MSNSDRRHFLKTSLTLGTAISCAGLSQNASAIEPIARNGTAKFKFSLAAYSYRELFKTKKLTLSDFIDDCAAFGLEGTELTSYYFPRPATHDYLRGLKRHAFRLGLDVSGTAVGNDFCHPMGVARQKQIDSVKQWIDFAEILGAPVIRIFSGNRKGDMTEAAARSLAIAGIEECCEYAGQHGVHLALENHGGLTATADGMLQLVRAVNSPWFGVNLDTGNFHSEDIYGDLEKLAPYALNVQVKVTVSGSDRKKRESDFNKLASLLTAAKYRGYIVLEYEEKGDPRVECKRYLEQLRQAFA